LSIRLQRAKHKWGRKAARHAPAGRQLFVEAAPAERASQTDPSNYFNCIEMLALSARRSRRSSISSLVTHDQQLNHAA
jgi:hypothetical protein